MAVLSHDLLLTLSCVRAFLIDVTAERGNFGL